MNILDHPDKIGEWDVIRHYDTGHLSASYLVCRDGGIPCLGKRYPAFSLPSRKHGIILQEKLHAHPNIVNVHDYDFECDEPFVVTEYAQEGTIADIVHSWGEDGPLMRNFRRLFETLFATVGWLHSQGITHNTLRKDHIFIVDGVLKIGAFRNAEIHPKAHFNTSKDIIELARAYNAVMAAQQEILKATQGKMHQQEWQQKVESLDLAPPKPLAAQ